MPNPGKALLSIFGIMSCTAAMAADVQPNEVIVKYKAGKSRSRAELNKLYDLAGIKSVRHYTGLMKDFDQLILNDQSQLTKAISVLEASPLVAYAQPNYILHTLPVRDESTNLVESYLTTSTCWFGTQFPFGCQDTQATRPKLKPAPADTIPAVADPDLARTYGLDKIDAKDAWAIYSGSKDFVIADIDTGIDYNHLDLAFNIWRNPDPNAQDVVGYDFIHKDGLPYDDNGHGTHTAGTIGAVGENGVGISGVSQRVSIMSVKFLSGDGSGTTADAIRSIDYAVSHGAKVLSNSWGGSGGDNQALQDAVARAEAKDVLFVAAAGNESVDNDDSSQASYPAAFTNANMLTVAATDSNDRMASFSNYGATTTHIGAPGVSIYSTAPGGKYRTLSGTSMACPHAAGAAALLWSKHPEWTYKKVKEVLMATVDPVSDLQGKTITGGRLNILKALQYQQ